MQQLVDEGHIGGGGIELQEAGSNFDPEPGLYPTTIQTFVWDLRYLPVFFLSLLQKISE